MPEGYEHNAWKMIKQTNEVLFMFEKPDWADLIFFT